MTRALILLCACLSLVSCGTEKTPKAMRVAFNQPLLIPIIYQGREMYQSVRPWTVTVPGRDETLPMGLVVDGASVPRAFWPFMPPDGAHRGGAFLHDYSYILQGHFPDGLILTRKETDEAFYNLMLEGGVSPTRAGIAYRAVRCFGQSAWDSREDLVILPVNLAMAAKHQKRLFPHLYDVR